MKNDPNYKTLFDMPDWDAEDQTFEEAAIQHHAMGHENHTTNGATLVDFRKAHLNFKLF